MYIERVLVLGGVRSVRMSFRRKGCLEGVVKGVIWWVNHT